MLFVVPKAHWVAALNGCHWEAKHQGHDCTLSLLQEHLFGLGWPAMCDRLSETVHDVYNTRAACLRPLYTPIMAIASLDLLHVDFTSIETTLNQTSHLQSLMSWYSKTTS